MGARLRERGGVLLGPPRGVSSQQPGTRRLHLFRAERESAGLGRAGAGLCTALASSLASESRAPLCTTEKIDLLCRATGGVAHMGRA